MRIVTEEDIEGCVLIGNDNDRGDFFPAVIGVAKDKSHVVYSREKLEHCFMKQNDWTIEEAVEWVDYNVERALPYYGSRAPVIVPNNFISTRNKLYEPVRLVKEE